MRLHRRQTNCITVASGTEALLISLMALGVKAGDEVITTSFTFVATAEVIALLGAKPVFVDVEPDTCNIKVSEIEAKITRAPGHHPGVAVRPMRRHGRSQRRHGPGTACRSSKTPRRASAPPTRAARAANLSTIGCTSFFPSKPLGCYGDGGALFTNDDELAQAMREIRVHGQSGRYYHTRIGVGGRMDTLQCAVVLGKLERFDWENRPTHQDRRALPATAGRFIRRRMYRNRCAPDRDSVWGPVHRHGAQPRSRHRPAEGGRHSHRRALSAPIHAQPA